IRAHLVLLSAGPDRLLSGLCLVAPGVGLPPRAGRQASRPDHRARRASQPDEEARGPDQEGATAGLRPVLRRRRIGILPSRGGVLAGPGSGWSLVIGPGSLAAQPET